LRARSNGSQATARLFEAPIVLFLILGFAAAAVGTSTPAPAEDAGVNVAFVANYASGEVLVRYRRSAKRDEVASLEAGVSAQRVQSIKGLGVKLLRVPAGTEDTAIAALARNPLVKFAERNALVATADTIPNDTYWSAQWSAVKTLAPSAWSTSTGSPAVVIAVLDTGVDPAHPDLQGKLTAGRDFVNGDDDPSDDAGHGTSVAGIVGAVGNNAMGVAGYCWQCMVMPVKVLGSDGTGLHSSVADGIVWAANNGAQIINMSLAGGASSKTLQSAVQYAARQGVLMIAAAGNHGSTTATYPAAYSEVVGVAGTMTDDTLYSWSNDGPWISIAAPGWNYTTSRGGGYGAFAGTSSAAPVVAGIAGLAYSFAPEASARGVTDALLGGAVFMGSDIPFGRVEALGTLVQLGASAEPSASPAPSASPSPTATAAPSASPTAAPDPSPTPTASDTPSPSASPSPTSEATPSPSTSTSPDDAPTTTKSFRGSLNAKNPERSFAVTTGSGRFRGALEFAGPPTLTITLRTADGSVAAEWQGPSVITLETLTSSGTHSIVVRGDGTKTNFRLSVTYVNP
jgi:thermitase